MTHQNFDRRADVKSIGSPMIIATLFAAALLTLALPASARTRMLENSTEASPAQLVLPTRVGGSLLLRGCPSCASKSIATTADTLYELGDEALSLDRFAQLLRDNPNINLTVMTDIKTGVVTRVRITGTPVRARSR